MHSEPSLDLLHVMNQEDDLALLNNRGETTNMAGNGGEPLHTSTHEQIRDQVDPNLRRLNNHHYSQHVERQ